MRDVGWNPVSVHTIRGEGRNVFGLVGVVQCERGVVNTSLSLGYFSLMRSPQLSITGLLPRFRLVKKSILNVLGGWAVFGDTVLDG